MYVIDHIKAQLHRDIAADPVTHAWTLNLYLNCERCPQTVSEAAAPRAALGGAT